MKKFITLVVFMIFPFAAMAKPVTVKVNGMVCGFCVSTIQKNFYQNDEVRNVKIDLNSKSVIIDFKESKSMTDQQITDIIVSNGYAVEKIDRK